MAFTVRSALPDVAELNTAFPPDPQHRVEERREEVRAILRGADERKFFVVGPCSAWPMDAVRTYADRLARLQEDVRGQVLLILRTYIQKPRTTVGWPGPLNQPDPLVPVDIARGIRECRSMMHDIAKQIGIADEALFTHNADYFGPLLTWIALGARSGEDMEHRYVVSGLDAPVGIKHPTSGNIQVGVNSVLSAQHPHTFAYNRHEVETSGNPYAHLILRGGGGRSNYDPQSIAEADKLLRKAGVQNPAVVVDASHDNAINGSGKDPTLQAVAVRSVLLGIADRREEYAAVKGFMAESFLQEGAQPIAPDMRRDGLSVTDPCLGWEKTERLIRTMADTLADIRGNPARHAV